MKRQIPGFADCDAMGCYPLFTCQNWSRLSDDLEELGSEVVSLTAVIDPFGKHNITFLHECFRDLVRPFKQHYVVNLCQPIEINEHHRRYTKKAERSIRVEKCEDPTQFIDEWVSLYDTLIKRHNIKGIPAFSRASFAGQMQVPGIIAFRAIYEGTTVGMTLWYVQGEVGYYHLGAYSDLGYELYASFGIFWYGINHFASRLKWLDLGGGAGLKSDPTDGLAEFKRGWSTETRITYFCGRIFDSAKYQEIVKARAAYGTDYFPAYRRGEFG